MKLNKDYEIKNVLDSTILINIKSNFDNVIKLNNTSKDILECINQNKNINETIDYLYNKYQVDKDVLTKDVNSFINTLIEKGILIND